MADRWRFETFIARESLYSSAQICMVWRASKNLKLTVHFVPLADEQDQLLTPRNVVGASRR